jgi:hypothetical protein
LHELRKSGIAVSQQHRVVVRYDGIVVGDNAVDLFVERIGLVELTVAEGSRDSSCAVPELSESRRPASLPAAQLRQALSGVQTHRPGPVRHRRNLRILRDLRFIFLAGRWMRYTDVATLTSALPHPKPYEWFQGRANTRVRVRLGGSRAAPRPRARSPWPYRHCADRLER